MTDHRTNWDLKKRIKDKGFTQNSLATKIGMFPHHMSGLVNGWYRPDDREKKELVRQLGKDVLKIIDNN